MHFLVQTVLAVLLLGCCLQSVYGLFPDEAGRIDWYRAQIGVPTKLIPHTANDTSLLYASTQRNVVAALRVDDGQIAWRHVLDEPIRTLLVRDERVLTQSGANESHVRVWDAAGGSLSWQVSVPGAGRAAAFVRGSSDVIAVAGDTLVRLTPESSSPVWELGLNNTAVYQRIVIHDDSVFVIGDAPATRKRKRRLHVVQVEASTGVVQLQYDTAEEVALRGGSVVALETRDYGAYLVWREPKNILWYVHRLGMTSPMWEIYHAKLVEVELMPPEMLSSTISEVDIDPGLKNTARFTLTYEKDSKTKTVVVEMFRDGDRLEMRKIASFLAPGRLVAAGPEHTVVAARSAESGATWRIRGSEKHSGDFVYARSSYGDVVRTALTFVNGQPHVVVQTASGLLAALQPGSDAPVWSRNEALAHAADMALLELLPPASSAEHAAQETDPSVQPSAVARFVLRWLAAARALGNWAASGFGIAGTHRPALGPTDGDHFGFRKLAVFGSATGAVTAVGSQDGAHAWSHHLAVGRAPVRIEHVFVARSGHVLGDAAPVVVAVGRGRNSTVVAAFDALTGNVLSQDVLPFVYVRAFELPATDSASGLRVLGLVVDGSEPRLAVWPATSDAVDAVCAFGSPLFFELGDTAGSTAVRGYRIECSSPREPQLPARLEWEFALPAGERLVSAARYENGARHTALQGRVLGDRRVLYKYLNPHLGMLATQHEQGIGVYVIDRVSGRLLHSAVHEYASVSRAHPFLATLSENRVIYQFWQGLPEGYVTAVIELFESDRPDTRDERTVVSSSDLRVPSVHSAAFVSPGAATALGTTRTGSSITTRDVLFGLASGKLLALPDALLDPRRPMRAPTKDEQAEGLMEYAAPLPLDPRRVLSHQHMVAGIRHVVSEPTHLESTAVVAAFGLDVFFTRTSPSGGFDQLAPSFSKANLVITTLALAAGCLLGAPMVRRKLTNRAWA
ncbi:hypothetical protein LPJ79_000683 [Coemansia sp. RSA 1821]|nr:hypothetical protein LPJ68_003840 [Coemansia sp. RSA 1086]KAJ1753043.1 hypothetical protein LPJ79_000683 [Coemansia sp. RSA 1821]